VQRITLQEHYLSGPPCVLSSSGLRSVVQEEISDGIIGDYNA